MSKVIKNTDQSVDGSKFGDNFDKIFGEHKVGGNSGKYAFNPITKEWIRIGDPEITKAMNDIAPSIQRMRDIGPITIKGKQCS